MKYIESNIPEHLRLKVIHLHQGNCTQSKLKKHGKTNAKYVTIARLLDDWNEVVGKGLAACSNKDCPSRQLGRSIAVGRALADYTARGAA